MPSRTSPPSCSLLSVGQAFVGTQNVDHTGTLGKEEKWTVHVRIQGCDLRHGTLCGSMEALNVPAAESSVVTYWEGEIVDNINHTFFTEDWANPDTDLKHWARFPSFKPLREAVNRDGGKGIDLARHSHVYMRWKEKFFVNVGPDCGLTIAGFYYLCFSRADGSIHGFYYDPNSSPYQQLELRATTEGRNGHSFGSYEFR